MFLSLQALRWGFRFILAVAEKGTNNETTFI